ncbi:MAG: haloacid dehalogenase [Chloroflexi bacterium]|nr:MAG: haloacid dehalogenase [Chloroflexota bacterium]
MEKLDEIADRIHQAFEARTSARDQALTRARTLTRHSANAIRAIHRGENEDAEMHLAEGEEHVRGLQQNLTDYPDLYYAGYTQDALKEFAEATLFYSLIRDKQLASPEDLHLEYATYLQGLAEAASELRRRCLDMLLKGNSEEAKRVVALMDDIYSVLVTMDYPDAITGGLRRLTDLVRGVSERTRADLMLSLRQENLAESLQQLEERLRSFENPAIEG